MERKARAAAVQNALIYEDFDPPTTLAGEPGQDTLILEVQDFRKDHLKVQITTSLKLRITGECPLGNNKWKRFRKEIPIASNYDANEISAKLVDFKLHVILPKLIAPHEPEPESPSPADKTASASDSVQDQTRGQEQATQLPQGANVPQKTASMEQQSGNKPSGAAGAKEYGSQLGTGERGEARQDVNVPSKTSAEKTSGRMASGAASAADIGGASVDADDHQIAKNVSRKIESLGDDLGEEMEKFEDAEASNDVVGESRGVVKGLKQGAGVLVKELKNSRILKSLAVAVLFLLMLLFYARNAIKPITQK